MADTIQTDDRSETIIVKSIIMESVDKFVNQIVDGTYVNDDYGVPFLYKPVGFIQTADNIGILFMRDMVLYVYERFLEKVLQGKPGKEGLSVEEYAIECRDGIFFDFYIRRFYRQNCMNMKHQAFASLEEFGEAVAAFVIRTEGDMFASYLFDISGGVENLTFGDRITGFRVSNSVRATDACDAIEKVMMEWYPIGATIEEMVVYDPDIVVP